MSRRVTILGAGRIGRSLAAGLAALGHTIELRSRHPQGIPLGPWRVAAPNVVTECDLCILAVPDDALDQVAEMAATVISAEVALHTAGSRNADALIPFKHKGAHTASLHPLRSISQGGDTNAFQGAWFAVDGDEDARAVAVELAESLGGRTLEVPADGRGRYHLGATIAANFTVVLAEWALEEFTRAGVEGESQAAIADLVASVARNLVLGADAALTGPIARGDDGTVGRHLALSGDSERRLYSLLSLRALDIAERRGLDSVAVSRLRQELEGDAG